MPFLLGKAPFLGVCLSFIFKEEIQAWWKGIRAKFVNNTYQGSVHWMKSHNFGQGEYVIVNREKARGKGAGCHITYINTGRTACLPWAVYSQYEFQDLGAMEKKACEEVYAYNQSRSQDDEQLTVEGYLKRMDR